MLDRSFVEDRPLSTQIVPRLIDGVERVPKFAVAPEFFDPAWAHLRIVVEDQCAPTRRATLVTERSRFPLACLGETHIPK